ncbi:hypothetical protein JXM67_12660 [candidate division WOR-3 bacterium]|nr:hypothetical protein [candidate division WOR-3 bacterium]
MAKARGKLADILSGWSKRVFKYLSDHESQSRVVRWLKHPILGFFVITIGWLSAGSVLTGIICCYTPIMTEPHILESSVEPNPTAGADTVTVKANAVIEETRKEADTLYINEGICIVGFSDTIQMEATDGAFDEKEENMEGKIYVGDREPGSKVNIDLEVYNNADECDSREFWVDVTEEE